MFTAAPVDHLDFSATKGGPQGEGRFQPLLAFQDTHGDEKQEDFKSQDEPGKFSFVEANAAIREAFTAWSDQSGQEAVEITVEFTARFPEDWAGFETGTQKVATLEETLDGFLNLPENHNGEDAAPVSPAAVFAAKLIVNNLYSAYGILCDDVSPMADGGVEIETESAHIYFDLWVFDRSTVKYVVKRGEKIKSGTASVSDIPKAIWTAIA